MIKNLILLLAVWQLNSFNCYAVKTFQIKWLGDSVVMTPKRMRGITITRGKSRSDIFLVSKRKDLRILLLGKSDNGSFHIESENPCDITLDGLRLTSLNGPAIEGKTHKMLTNIILAEGTSNQLCDSASYKKKESGSIAKACMAFAGDLKICGNGLLSVEANKKHGIKCNDFSITSGKLNLRMVHDAAKGLECKSFLMTGGIVTGKSTSNIIYKDSVCTISSLIKCNGPMTITGGTLNLTHNGKGSRCILCNDTLYIKGGNLRLNANGDGGWFGERPPGKYFFSMREYRTYYSSHCLNAKNLFIERGSIECTNTGTGGKGIVAENYLQCGLPTDGEHTSGLTINVDTKGKCIVNDVDLDQRDGCPKGITARKANIYSGNIDVKTFHMGGEGLEADSLEIWYPILNCNTYDDGINVQKDVTIHGGEVFCNSKDNDGIDSNCSIHIDGGIVASISQEVQNESFDSDNAQFYLTGGVIFGVSNSMVKLPTMDLPIYNTKAVPIPNQIRWRPDLVLASGDYINVMHGDSVVMTLLNTDDNDYCSILLAHPEFKSGNAYRLMISKERPTNTERIVCDGHLSFGGEISNEKLVPLRDIVTEPWTKFEINKKKKDK